MSDWKSIDIDDIEDFADIAKRFGHVFVDCQRDWDFYFIVAKDLSFPLVYTCNDSSGNRSREELESIFGDVFICNATLEGEP